MTADYLTDPDYRQRLLTAALGYANQGWHIFPLRPGSKKPAVPDHPAHDCDHTDPKCRDGHTGWEARATTNPDRITRAWTRRPYGIAIACGPSGLLVIDLDTAPTEGEPSGIDTWVELARTQPLDATYTVDTPTGGHHRYYHHPHGVTLGNTASKLGPRIDTRACGGYVVAPPTRTSKLGVYKITCPRSPSNAPAWVLDALTPTPPPPSARPRPRPPHTTAPTTTSNRVRLYVDTAIDGESRRLQQATAVGTRNHALFKAALALGQLVGAELLGQDIAERVLWANTTHHIAAGAYTQSEAAATIASGLNRRHNDPRQLPANLTDPNAVGVGV